MNIVNKPRIIAEAGSNHNGSVESAKKLIDIALNSKADSVKFQFIFAEGLYLEKFQNTKELELSAVFHIRKAEEFTDHQWQEIWEYAQKKDIDISASVFCEKGVQLLSKLGASYVKIASTDLTNHYLIGLACSKFKNVIVSTGMANQNEISDTISFVSNTYPETKLTIMHCVSLYPCPLESSNIYKLKLLQDQYDFEIGYSDHTEDNFSSVMAFSLGVRLFEKHFTFNKELAGFDHAHAQDPLQLNNYISTLHKCYQSLVNKSEQISENEKVSKIRARRGVYLSKTLRIGEKLKSEDILFVRPSSSFFINDPKSLVGLEAKEDIPAYSAIGVDGSKIIKVNSNWDSANDYWLSEMTEKGMSS